MNRNGFHDRKELISGRAPDRHTALRAAAEALSRRNVDAAIVELMMEALQRLTVLAYEVDADGLCNVDGVTGRLLIAAPWGRNGHQQWGLRSGESVILREMMQRRQPQRVNRAPGLFLYDKSGRTWLVNFFDYETYADAERYWTVWPLSVAEYREARAARLEK